MEPARTVMWLVDVGSKFTRDDMPCYLAINEESCLEHHCVRRLLDSLYVSTEVWILPAMNGDAKRRVWL